jgi:hypothetical protein
VALVPFASQPWRRPAEEKEEIGGEVGRGLGRDDGSRLGAGASMRGQEWMAARVFWWELVLYGEMKKNNGQDLPSGKIQRTRGSNRCEFPYGGHQLYL